MKEQCLISVIMPAYNAETYIASSIESVLKQTYTNWELIIVDDGSIDNTESVVSAYVHKDKRIFYSYQENGKAGKARNLGIRECKGELIAFLDSDDLWLPEKLEISVKELLNGDQDLLFTNSYIFDKDTDLDNIKGLSEMNVKSGIYSGEDGLDAFLYRNLVPTLTVVLKKDILEKVGGFPENIFIAEDYYLWLEILLAGYKLKSIELPLSLYRVHNQSTTGNDKISMYETIWMLRIFFQKYPSLKVKYRKQIINWLARYVNDSQSRTSVRKVINKSYLLDFGIKYKVQLFLLRLGYLLPLKLYKYIFFHTLIWQNSSQ